MLEKIGSFSIIAFLLSFVLGVICLFYIFKILINKRIVIKVMEDSLGDAATSPSIISLVCVILGIFSASFFSICIGIYFFTFAVY
jgi:hypothetical protein